MKPLTRRSLLAAAMASIPAALLGGASAVVTGRDQGCAEEVEGLLRTIRVLSLNTASGGGVNLKLMPHPVSGEPTVPLPEVFSFDRHHALCRVDTNPEAFVMPTFAMGDVTVEAHRFFMAMVATSIDRYAVSSEPDGSRRARLSGGVACSTEVGQASTTIGSRSAAEHAAYRIEATDAGVGGGEAGDRFAFTALFDPDEAPVNHAIFGPEFTFTGTMIAGEITIVDPDQAA